MEFFGQVVEKFWIVSMNKKSQDKTNNKPPRQTSDEAGSG